MPGMAIITWRISPPCARAWDGQMRDKSAYALATLGAVVLVRNLYLIFMVMPMIYRLLYFHVPAWWTAFIAVALSATFSGLYLAKKDLRYDAMAVSVTEVAMVFLTMGIALGSIWGLIIWGSGGYGMRARPPDDTAPDGP